MLLAIIMNIWQVFTEDDNNITLIRDVKIGNFLYK